jgi:hypothetical protein
MIQRNGEQDRSIRCKSAPGLAFWNPRNTGGRHHRHAADHSPAIGLAIILLSTAEQYLSLSRTAPMKRRTFLKTALGTGATAVTPGT